MRKFLFTAIILLLVSTSYSQLNNSWINYGKTYYKFKLTKDTLCRIYQPALAAVGLTNTPAQNFQLWRNGKEVRLYTSVASGTFGATDFIEFWGQANDGKPDKTLYRDTTFQLDDKFSLFSDTAAYFLTVNTGANLRYTQSANPVATNVLPADAYFMRRVEQHYRDQLNPGYAAILGESVYSSSFDIGEGWSSGGINQCCALSNVFTDINKYANGPANSVMFTLTASGDALETRNVGASINGTSVFASPNPMPYFGYHKDTVRNLPLSILTSPSFAAVAIGPQNSSNASNDRISVPSITITYPATFNFNNQKQFYFELGPSASGNYLVITNFNNNGVQPILYDMNNGLRYLGDISTSGQVKFALPASSDAVRQFNLISQETSNVNLVTSLTTRNFIDVTNTANQANYIIISNSLLYNNGSGINYVDQYRQYRSSVAGGSYNAKVYDIDELTDQFGFGINRHPTAIRDFIRYANSQFTSHPKFVLLIGRAVNYMEYKQNETAEGINKLNLVPTFGWPASDVLLASDPGTVVQLIPIGRLGAVNGNEIGNYLDKMKEYEQVQANTSQTLNDKAWMKNIIHISGGADSSETTSFVSHLEQYRIIAVDTLFGAHVETFAKSTTGSVQETSATRVDQLMNDGVSFITYFGHSSANLLAFNLSNPDAYQNQGKYPFINVSGCSAGNFFNYNPNRITGDLSLSEKYVFAKEKGSIAFFADTHYGIEPFLNYFNTTFYNEFCRLDYGGTVGEQLKRVNQLLGSNPQSLDYYTRMHLEELALHGDPALRINNFAKPDYDVEEQLIKISPSIISVADSKFTLKVNMLNLGQAIHDSIRVSIKRKLPDNTIQTLYDSTILAIQYSDSIVLTVLIDPTKDKGLNKIMVTLDVNNRVSELSESNNYAEKEFTILEDELRPVSPYNFAIINQQNLTFTASTANPLGPLKQYNMEIDTTELFNSSFKKSFSASGVGGVVEFKPTGITFTDSTVYYWRTSMVPSGATPVIWNTSSFVYLPTSTNGWNQSHVYQHFKSTYSASLVLDSVSRQLKFSPRTSDIISNNGMFPVSLHVGSEFNVLVNGAQYIQDISDGVSLVFYLFNPASLDPVINAPAGQPGRWGSIDPYSTLQQYNFEFSYSTNGQRELIKRFMDSIPSGYYVVVKNSTPSPSFYPTVFANTWQAQDLPIDGAGNTLVDKLRNLGFATIDSFNRGRAWTFVYKKNDATNYAPRYSMSQSDNDVNSFEFYIYGRNAEGTITSPVFGPSKKWENLHWRGSTQETPSADSINIGVYGINNAGTSTLLKTVTAAQDTTLGFIDPVQYPYVQLKMYNSDFSLATPYQLKYWRINGQLIPEGAIAPNILFQMKDTVLQGAIIDFKVAFKNISSIKFDSTMKLKLTITDNNNIPHVIPLAKGKVLNSGDTLTVQYSIDTKDYPGNNTLFIEVNPDFDQEEQAHFNNVLFKNFYVISDNVSPLLDVTFDGVHILNKDIVAAKPHIYIKLKDENKFLALTDTSAFKVQVRYPDNTLHSYNYGDTMHFNPANLATGENTASIDFAPYFTLDGDYELIVTGKDVVGNKAGAVEYHVMFSVINKPMISNLLNYPNPFTSSTAFVFTVTGSEIPQNIRIQILTISGKVVREITKDELGPIHVGRNITDFKWDGTDTYGQKLANGVYLYRVLTNLNGKSLDKYKADGDDTDKYFTKGYGKMVLIR